MQTICQTQKFIVESKAPPEAPEGPSAVSVLDPSTLVQLKQMGQPSAGGLRGLGVAKQMFLLILEQSRTSVLESITPVQSKSMTVCSAGGLVLQALTLQI